MLFVEKDIAIDLGTSSVLFYVKGQGISLRESCVVAVDKTTGRPTKFGEEAQKMLGRTPANIVAINPIVSGVISDYDLTARMLKEYLKRITSFSMFKPAVLICVPGNVTGVEERAIIDACIEAGARKVYLVESVVATAVGAGVDVYKPDGHLVIDIGAGVTDIGVVSLGGVAECESIKTAGNSFDDAIVRYIRRKHNVLIGTKSAEELKKSIGSVYPRDEVVYENVKGRSLVTGLPEIVRVSSEDMIEALEEPCKLLLETVQLVLERTPPELISDISENGIIMSGGGSMIWGIDKLVEDKTGIETIVVDDALACASYGAGKMLQRLPNMSEGMINLARRRQMKA